MDKKLKECMKPHMLAHSVSGFGLGLVVANYVVGLQGNMGIWLGVALLAGGVLWDFSVNKG